MTINASLLIDCLAKRFDSIENEFLEPRDK